MYEEHSNDLLNAIRITSDSIEQTKNLLEHMDKDKDLLKSCIQACDLVLSLFSALSSSYLQDNATWKQGTPSSSGWYEVTVVDAMGRKYIGIQYYASNSGWSKRDTMSILAWRPTREPMH